MKSNESFRKKEQKMQKRMIAPVVGGMMFSSLLIFNPATSTFANELPAEAMIEVSRSTLPDVGQGIEWPVQVNAPFVDMGDWVTWGSDYAINGAPNLGRMAENSGAEFFKLGFIQATHARQIQDGRIVWGWGGHDTLRPGNASAQYEGIRQSIRAVRDMGGDIAVSLGGLDGITFWEVTHDVEILANTYRDLINEYGLTRLDLDIETGDTNWGTGSLERNGNIANARALAQIQEETGIEIVLTLPALPTGLLSGRGLEMLEIYLANGVDISIVNIMTMYFGATTFLPGESYAGASIRSAEATMRQIQAAYHRYTGTELTDAEAFKKVGVTPAIGMSDRNFTLADAEELVDFSIENGLGMVSFWAMNRDSMIGWDANHLTRHLGITTPYEFSNIFNRFMQDVERPEVPEVTPEEPEVAPEEPEVAPEEPEVAPEEPEVTPEEPEVAPEEPEVTPEEPETPGGYPEWSAFAFYTVGDRVIHNGQIWEARVTFQGHGDPNWAPGVSGSLWVRVG